MHPFRFLLLLAGPFALVGMFYGLTAGRGAAESDGWARGVVPQVGSDAAIPAKRTASDAEKGHPGERLAKAAELERACQRVASRLRTRLARSCEIIVRPPYVIGGDGEEADLQSAYDRLLLPIAEALRLSYFETTPDAPIAVLLFSDEGTFQEHADRLDGHRRHDYYGYYRREERRMILNVSTGAGTVAHEMTHALAHVDFPAMPEWFDEGLASLHEEAEFSPDGAAITGYSNWRVNHLLLGLRRNTARTTEEMLSSSVAVRPGHDAVDYAHARYFCLYLQQRGVLSLYYRALRDAARTGGAIDAGGTLRDVIAPQTIDEFDADFRMWVSKFRPVSRRIPHGVRRL